MGFPFRKVLAPVDFHEHALGALEVAKNIAQRNDGTVTLLYVTPMDEPIGGKMYEDDFKKQAVKDVERLAELASQRMQGINYEVLTEIGDAATAIIDTAAKKAMDVIVMGTHGRQALMRVLMGSVAEQVLREAPCPVIVYRLEKKN
jgi:nucleotide-binding universal stress UspA family protein